MADKTGSGAIVVEGLNDLVRAFRVANRGLAKDMRAAIEQAGEPIRQEAQKLVREEVSGMARSKVPWWTIRAGVERNTIGYIVPNQRGVRYGNRGPNAVQAKRKRPNLAPLIAEQEEIARNKHSDRVVDEFNDALEELARAWARV